jgi:hypothetical protein
LAALGAAAMGLYGLLRRQSGRIATSEASELWGEGRALREWLSEQLKERDHRLEKAEAEIVDCRTRDLAKAAIIDRQAAQIEELQSRVGTVENKVNGGPK